MIAAKAGLRFVEVAPLSGRRKVLRCDREAKVSPKFVAPGGSGSDGQSAFASDGWFCRHFLSLGVTESQKWRNGARCALIQAGLPGRSLKRLHQVCDRQPAFAKLRRGII